MKPFLLNMDEQVVLVYMVLKMVAQIVHHVIYELVHIYGEHQSEADVNQMQLQVCEMLIHDMRIIYYKLVPL